MISALLLLFASFAPQAAEPAAPLPPPEKGLECLYLGDEAFLLRSPKRSVLVDGFLGPAAGRPAMPEAVRGELRRAEKRFEAVDVSVATHFHGASFRLDEAIEFVRGHFARRHRPLVFEVPSSLKDHFLTKIGLEEREFGLLSRRRQAPGKQNRFMRPGLRIDYLNLPHADDEQGKIEYNAVLAHFPTPSDDLGLLYAPHTVLGEEQLGPYRELIANTQILAVTYTDLLDPDQRHLLRRRVAPRYAIALGVPAEEAAELVPRLEAAFPGVFVPVQPLDRHVFEAWDESQDG